jgi:hypothetical protein
MKILLFTLSFLALSTCSQASLLDESSASCAAHFAAFKESITGMYAHSTVVGENNQVGLFWEVVGNKLTMAVAAAANGWVGFGVSDTGAMKGADIVVFEAATQKLNDYCSLNYEPPRLDDCLSNWSLRSNMVEGDFIAFEASHLVNTNDLQDIAFYNDSDTFGPPPPTLVISAWGDQPLISFLGSGNDLQTSLCLFQNTSIGKKDNYYQLLKEISDDSSFVTANNFTLPKVLSHYHICCINVEDLEGVAPDEHINIIGITQSLSLDNNGVDTAKYVHHFSVSALPGKCPAVINYSSFVQQTFYVWAPGQDPMIFPDKVSFPIGQGC